MMDTTRLDEAIEAAENADPVSAFVDPAAPSVVRAWPDGLPQPGIYYDMPYEEYRALPAVNSSALKILASVTPKHCKAYIDGLLDKDTPHRLKGRAFHCALLEPMLFGERFPRAGLCPEPLGSGKRKGSPCGNQGTFFDREAAAWFCGTHAKAHPGAVELDESITQDQHASIENMRREVFAHKVVSLLRQQGGSEVSLVWERDGVPCKSRIDKLIIDRACPDTVIDLKKIQPMAGTEKALQSAVSNYGYDLAAWWYVSGVKALRPDKPAPLFAWIFAEDAPPFDVRPAWASKALLEIGRIKAERAFTNYRWCLQSGKWPGYTDDIEELMPSDWEAKRYGLAQ
jgi:hypothetical protein